MRGSQSSATQVDDHRKTSKRGVILLQAMREVQAIREVGQERLLADDGNGLGYVCGWSIPAGCARRGVTPAKGRVTEFKIAGSDDAASGQQVQRGSFLLVVRSAQR